MTEQDRIWIAQTEDLKRRLRASRAVHSGTGYILKELRRVTAEKLCNELVDRNMAK